MAKEFSLSFKKLERDYGYVISLANEFIGGNMLHWALVFFIIAIIAALFGFGGIAAAATEIAKILFYLFLVLFLVSLLLGLLR